MCWLKRAQIDCFIRYKSPTMTLRGAFAILCSLRSLKLGSSKMWVSTAIVFAQMCKQRAEKSDSLISKTTFGAFRPYLSGRVNYSCVGATKRGPTNPKERGSSHQQLEMWNIYQPPKVSARKSSPPPVRMYERRKRNAAYSSQKFPNVKFEFFSAQ